jgi:hypothetical protein
MRQTRYFSAVVLAALAIQIGLGQDNNQRSAKPPHYKLIDLGSFGGPQAYIPNFLAYTGFQARVLDNRGVVIGEADTSLPEICGVFFDCFVSHTFRAETGGEPTDLGALPGGGSSAPLWMSHNGLIAGVSKTAKWIH